MKNCFFSGSAINRILIWHYQLARINNLENSDDKVENLKNCIAVLYDKPTIEIAGLKIKQSRDRVSFDFSSIEDCQLAAFTNKNKVRRLRNEGIETIINGIKKLDRPLILEGVASFLVTIE